MKAHRLASQPSLDGHADFEDAGGQVRRGGAPPDTFLVHASRPARAGGYLEDAILLFRLKLVAADVFAILCGAVAAANFAEAQIAHLIVWTELTLIAFVALLALAGAYRVKSFGGSWVQGPRLAIGLCIIGLTAALLPTPPPGLAPASLLVNFAAAAVPFIVLRLWLARGWRRRDAQGRLDRRVVIIGDLVVAGHEAAPAGTVALRALPKGRIAITEVRAERQAKATTIGRAKLMRERGLLERMVGERDLHEVVLAFTPKEARLVSDIVRRLSLMPVDVSLAGPTFGVQSARLPTRLVAGLPCVRIMRRPFEGWTTIAKSVSDRVIAALAFCLFAPLMLVVALAIRLDSKGPVLYRQKRHGYNRKVIEVLKFRTMHVAMCDDGTGAVVRQATAGDPRVTRVGRLLRKTSLDELPQFINVLLGQMSVVGPRPHAIAHNIHFERLIDGYAARYRVKPGITGWAQINGYRGETSALHQMVKRIAYDLEYIDNWNLILDVKIVFKTLLVGFVHPEAK